MIKIKCFFKGHDYKPLVHVKKIVNGVKMTHDAMPSLGCTRCGRVQTKRDQK